MNSPTTEQPTTDNPTIVKPRKPLTRKQTAFIKHLVDNPKASATAAAKAAYNTTTSHSAEVVAHENMRKPEIQAELAKYESTAESTLVEVMDYSRQLGKTGTTAGASYASTAGSLANSILDRLRGKATQRIEQHSTTVTLSLSLEDITGVSTDLSTADAHPSESTTNPKN